MTDVDLEEIAEVARKNPRRMTKKRKQEMDATFLGMDFAKLIKSGKILVDIGNHFYTPSGDKSWVKEYIETNLGWSLFLSLPPDDIVALAKIIKEDEPPSRWFRFRESCLFKCHQCGKDVGLETNGKEVRCYNPCEYPEGMPAYSIKLNVPSGKMVIANDLRRYFRVIGDYNINALTGSRKTTEQYENVGMAYFYVGNTCPSVFKVNDKHYAVGTYGSQGQSPSKGSRRVAGICTDLWWYCVVDYNEFIRRAGREPDAGHEDVIRVVPGVWKFTHQHHKLNHDDYRNPQLYSFIEWIGEPEPERDFLGEWNSLNYTAEQIIANGLRDGKGNLSEIMRRADYLMCVCGSGVDYHPNGWMSNNPNLDPNLAVKIPTFNKRFRWYPQSKSSIIPRAAGIGADIFSHDKTPVFLNPSFVRLAFNICRCIILYGVDCGASFRTDKEAEKEEKSAIALMKRSIKGLARIYPSLVPQNCRELV